MTSRADIAAAMTATGVVNVTGAYRQTLKPGEGMVRWAGTSQASNRFGWVTTWQVWIALPQDVAAAEVWVDANMAALVDAANNEMTVTQVSPQQLALGDTLTNGLIIEGGRAAD